jgi:hypothetical protein
LNPAEFLGIFRDSRRLAGIVTWPGWLTLRGRQKLSPRPRL